MPEKTKHREVIGVAQGVRAGDRAINLDFDRFVNADRTFAKWSPSTDISAAMEVVEKMHKDGYAVLMRRVNKWYVEFSPRTVNPEQDFGRAQDELLPRAIYLAALNALGCIPADSGRK